jgi:hypothetical protein
MAKKRVTGAAFADAMKKDPNMGMSPYAQESNETKAKKAKKSKRSPHARG